MDETCNLDRAADVLKNNLLSKKRRKSTQRPTRHPVKSPEQPEQPEQPELESHSTENADSVQLSNA